MSQPSQPACADAGRPTAPSQLRELARLELKKRQLLRELAGVCCEMYQVNREIQELGIKMPMPGMFQKGLENDPRRSR